MSDTSEIDTALSELSKELEGQGLTVRFQHNGARPELVVTNPESGLSETIRIQDGDFAWSWRQSICPTPMHAIAAVRISRVLGAVQG